MILISYLLEPGTERDFGLGIIRHVYVEFVYVRNNIATAFNAPLTDDLASYKLGKLYDPL